MIKVITFGVFDLLHYGHINLFRRAKYFGDYLIVAVQDDESVVKNKPNTKLINNLVKRKQDVLNVEYVAKVVEYSQIDEDIKRIAFDVLVVGEDQTNLHFVSAIDWCKKNNKEVVFLSRTKGVSSTLLREKR